MPKTDYSISDLECAIIDLKAHVYVLEIVGKKVFDEPGGDWQWARSTPLQGHHCYILSDNHSEALSCAFNDVLAAARDVASAFASYVEGTGS